MKKCILTLLICFSGSVSRAQPEFFHGAGVGFLMAFDNSVGASGWATMYYPKFNFPMSKATSFSAGIPLMLAFDFNSRSGGSFLFDLPLAIEFNMGYGSTDKAYRNVVGFFIGTGPAFTSIAASGISANYLNINLYTGLRMEIREKPLALRVNYGKGIGDYSEINKIGITLNYLLSYM